MPTALLRTYLPSAIDGFNSRDSSLEEEKEEGKWEASFLRIERNRRTEWNVKPALTRTQALANFKTGCVNVWQGKKYKAHYLQLVYN